jgi:hypothetical protein
MRPAIVWPPTAAASPLLSQPPASRQRRAVAIPTPRSGRFLGVRRRRRSRGAARQSRTPDRARHRIGTRRHRSRCRQIEAHAIQHGPRLCCPRAQADCTALGPVAPPTQALTRAHTLPVPARHQRDAPERHCRETLQRDIADNHCRQTLQSEDHLRPIMGPDRRPPDATLRRRLASL